MNIRESVSSAWVILSRNKVRSFLTMLGIIIGVMAVIVIMSAGAGAQSLVVGQISNLGSNLVGVLPGKSEDKGPPVSVLGVVITTLTYDDARAIETGNFPALVAVASYVRGAATMVSRDNKTDATFVGTTGNYTEVEDAKVDVGRFFTREEERTVAHVVVLGSDIADTLFPYESPLNKQVKLKRTVFTVIGVMKKRGVVAFQNQDGQVFVPISTAQKLLLGIDHIHLLRARVDTAAHVDSAIEYIATVLRDRHRITNPENDDFTIRSANQGIEALTGITNAIRFFLAAIAGISLVVGGIGIMNIMLAAVSERTREIGLRKAIGATQAHITQQFLVETTLITVVGGVVGIVLGVVLSILVAVVVRANGYDWQLSISPVSIILGCVVSFVIGLIFGIVPARRASRLDPMNALRYE